MAQLKETTAAEDLKIIVQKFVQKSVRQKVQNFDEWTHDLSHKISSLREGVEIQIETRSEDLWNRLGIATKTDIDLLMTKLSGLHQQIQKLHNTSPIQTKERLSRTVKNHINSSKAL